MAGFLRNPYLNRSMIRKPERFFGRRGELMRIMQRLGASPPQSVAVVGDRRIGKSSLLNYISHPEIAASYLSDPANTIFLFLDFQETRGLGVESFFESLLRHLREALGGRVPVEESGDAEGFRTLLGRLESEGIRLILLLDEFDRVTRSASFDEGFFSSLRSLAGRFDVAFVTSSGRELQELCHAEEIADSPFFNIFTSVSLGSLTLEEARELVLTPAQGLPLPIADNLDLILELGGRWPFFLQIAASCVFEILVEQAAAPREGIYERFLEEVTPHFQFFWEQLDPVSRGLSNELAWGRVPVDGTALTDLIRRGFVLAEGPCLFSVCFADFIRDIYALEVGDLPIEVQAERARQLESEIDKARQIQVALLPEEVPRAEGLELAASVVPASEVSGDFYTFLTLDEGRKIGIVAVDVCGHGMASAVVAMRFSETLRYEARGRARPGEILNSLNRAVYGTLKVRTFVCCCICVVDRSTRQVEVATAGYPSPLRLRHRDQTISIPAPGAYPLGVRADIRYGSEMIPMEEGDRLLIFSDGVIEACDDRQTEYGQERLEALVRLAGRGGLSSDELIERLLREVGRFTAAAGSRADDITAIALRLLRR